MTDREKQQQALEYNHRDNTPTDYSCGFCYPNEHGTHGGVRQEWSDVWRQMIRVCRKHSITENQL